MKRRFAPVLILFAALAVPAGVRGESSARLPDSGLIDHYGFPQANVGYLVADLASGRVLASHQADRPFIPASVAKLPTVVAALEVLGGGYRFDTDLLMTGVVQAGILHGDLYLRGGGDPVLSADHLDLLARSLAAQGVTRVLGGFYFDAGPVIAQPQITDRHHHAAGYNPGISALSVNFNRVRLRWRKSNGTVHGLASAVSDRHDIPIREIGFATTPPGPPRRSPYLRAGTVAEDRWLLASDLPAKGEAWLPVADPALLSARIFRWLAMADGIALLPPQARPVPAAAQPLTRHRSEDLRGIAKRVLRYSNNLSAELVGLAASHRAAGVAVPLERSPSLLADWLRRVLPAVDWTGFRLENHSGLSSVSRVTPTQIVAILRYAFDTSNGAYIGDLMRPVALEQPDGSIVEVRAKSGNLSYVRSLAGYIIDAEGRRLVFAAFVNDLARRGALDAEFDPRDKHDDPSARRWRARARGLIHALVLNWAERY